MLILIAMNVDGLQSLAVNQVCESSYKFNWRTKTTSLLLTKLNLTPQSRFVNASKARRPWNTFFLSWSPQSSTLIQLWSNADEADWNFCARLSADDESEIFRFIFEEFPSIVSREHIFHIAVRWDNLIFISRQHENDELDVLLFAHTNKHIYKISFPYRHSIKTRFQSQTSADSRKNTAEIWHLLSIWFLIRIYVERLLLGKVFLKQEIVRHILKTTNEALI